MVSAAKFKKKLDYREEKACYLRRIGTDLYKVWLPGSEKINTTRIADFVMQKRENATEQQHQKDKTKHQCEKEPQPGKHNNVENDETTSRSDEYAEETTKESLRTNEHPGEAQSNAEKYKDQELPMSRVAVTGQIANQSKSTIQSLTMRRRKEIKVEVL